MRQALTRLHGKKLIGISWLYIAIFLAIIFITFWVLLGIHISFILKDDLTVNLAPHFISVSLLNNETTTTEITLTADSSLQCKSMCAYRVTDLSQAKEILSGNTSLTHDLKLSISLTLRPPNKGSGQIIYRIDSSCYNEKTILCPSDQKQKNSSTVITLNYNLTPEEEIIKASYGHKIPIWQTKLQTLQEHIFQEEILLDPIPPSDEQNILQTTVLDIRKQEEKSQSLLDRVQKTWKNEEYRQLPDIFTPKAEDAVDDAILQIRQVHNSTIRHALVYNKNTEYIQAFETTKQPLFSFILFLQERQNPITKNLFTNISLLMADYTYALNITSENVLSPELERINSNADSLLLIHTSILQKEKILKTYGKQLLLLKNMTLNSTNTGCNRLMDLVDTIHEANNASGQYNTTTNEYDSGLASRALSAFDNISKDELMQLLDIASATETNQTNYSNVLIDEQRYNTHLEKYCPDNMTNLPRIGIQWFKTQNTTRPKLNASLPDQIKLPIHPVAENPPLCCMKNDCQPCSSSFDHSPILFIHGHMLNDANNPESSANIFSPIQRRLETEGMIDFGEFYLTDQDIPPGDWGRTNASITLRSSYYYLTYVSLGEYKVATQKSENIETYALRLHDIIESLKYRTGRPNITIIAHSMGGLVVRQYLVIFGSGSVDQVILIGTPNQGISGAIKKFCKTFGASRECDDMTEGSIFLNRLNAVPSPSNIFMIRGTGCGMDGSDGDGIILAKNALLPDATNFEIKGNCTKRLRTNLHSELLDPERYPETYDLIVKILKKEYPLMP